MTGGWFFIARSCFCFRWTCWRWTLVGLGPGTRQLAAVGGNHLPKNSIGFSYPLVNKHSYGKWP